MRPRSSIGKAAAIGVAFASGLVLAPASLAATATIGSNLSGNPVDNICVAGFNCTYLQTSAGTPTAVVPFDGTIVTWRLKAGSAGGSATLRVLRPSAGQFTAVESSAQQTVALGINTFTTSLPVRQGDVIALDNASSGIYFAKPGGTSRVDYFMPALADGATGSPNNTRAGDELLLNADVQLAPPAAITDLRISPSIFPAASRGGSIARAARRTGARVSYRDSLPAITTFTVLRATQGVRRGTRCVRPRTGITGRRCTRYVRVGSFRHTDRAGTNRFHFTGRLRGHKLRPGRYRLRAVPRFAGRPNGTAVTRRFRIIP